jgi:hypothetical protein
VSDLSVLFEITMRQTGDVVVVEFGIGVVVLLVVFLGSSEIRHESMARDLAESLFARYRVDGAGKDGVESRLDGWLRHVAFESFGHHLILVSVVRRESVVFSSVIVVEGGGKLRGRNEG